MIDGLYMTPRTYFDSGCSEYHSYPIESKLLDIGYATWHGYDIMTDIRQILNDYSYVSESSVRHALWQLMAKLYNVDVEKYYLFDRNNSIETDVKIFIEDLMRIFRLPEGNRRKAYLAADPMTMRPR